MKIFLKPYWVYLTTMVPVAILFALYGGAYQVIHTLLSKQNLIAWAGFSGVLAFITLAFCAYALWCQISQRDLSARFGFFLVTGYVAFTYVFLHNTRMVIPWNVPQWMLFEGDLILYVLTFLMPAMAYGLLLAVISVTPEDKDYRTPINIGILVAIPAFWYFLFTIVMPMLSNHWHGDFPIHAVMIVFIATTLIFLACLIRLVYLMLLHRDVPGPGFIIVMRAILLLGLPVLCFIVYNGIDDLGEGLLGDFSHPIFYILAVGNGIVFLLPETGSRYSRLALLFLRSVFYAFVLYFFFVLLPFFPLSVLAILAFGFGFLMLTPIVVMILTTNAIVGDIRFVSKKISPLVAVTLFLIGFSAMPSCFVLKCLKDKVNMQDVLVYVFEPDYRNTAAGAIDAGAFTRTLKTIKNNKEIRGRRPENRMPYISPFYEWFVFENLTLSNRKLLWLDKIFTDTTDIRESSIRNDARMPTRSQQAEIGFTVDSKLSEGGDFTETWVHLEIQNGRTDSTEFATRFELPEGCWVDNYYLDIAGKREYGLLAEKKSATWIYQQITTRERRDPGVLFYTEGENTLVLRVYPFTAREKRTTGFHLVHRDDLTFDFQDTTITVKCLAEHTDTAVTKVSNGFAVPAVKKTELPLVVRKPVYCFIVDCSKSTMGSEDAVVDRIESFIEKTAVSNDNRIFKCMNYASSTTLSSENWVAAYRAFPKTGGFFLERALKEELLESFAAQKKSNVPIFIIVTDSYENAIFVEGFTNWGITFPDIPRFFVLGTHGELSQVSYAMPSTKQPMEPYALQPGAVRAWPDSITPIAFLPDNRQMSIVPEIGRFDVPIISKPVGKWNNGLVLRIAEKSLALEPTGSDEKWLTIVQGSMQTGILTGFTSFIALENEAQKQTLLKKQKQVLSAKKVLDIGEEHRMSEPAFWLVLMIIGAVLFFHQRKRHRV